jgi:hypothetical protein
MKFKVDFLFFLALAVGIPVYAANFEVNANLNSLDLVVERSTDGQVRLVKNFDETYFEYSENIRGNTIHLVSNAQIGINTSPYTEEVTYRKDKENELVMAGKAKVVVQVPDGVIIKVVSVNGGVTVNTIDCASIDIRTINGDVTLNKGNCDSIKLNTNNGSIYYTGKIEGKDIALQTAHGNINIVLEKGSEVDVYLQSRYSYTQHRDTGGPLVSGVEVTGYGSGRIINKRGSGTINITTLTGKIECKVY